MTAQPAASGPAAPPPADRGRGDPALWATIDDVPEEDFRAAWTS